MAGSVNKVILIGNLGRDPEIRTTQGGSRVASLSIATSETWKDRNGDRQERTEWHRVVVWAEGLVKLVEQYTRKGQKIYVEGQLQTRKWTDNKGQEQYTTEIVIQPYKGTITLLDAQRSGGNGGSRDDYDRDHDRDYDRGRDSGRSNGGRQNGSSSGRSAPPPSDLDDEIPF